MAGARGGSGRPVSLGSRTKDVRDFGVVMDDRTRLAANAAALQAAIDSFTFGGGGPLASLWFPAGDLYKSGPVFLRQVDLIGQGADVTRIVEVASGNDNLVVFDRAPLGVPLDPACVPDLFTAGSGGSPLLDATAVPASGRRWGYRSLGLAHIVQQGGPLDSGTGDWYASTPLLTIDLAIDFARATTSPNFPNATSVLGMTELGTPAPFVLYLASGAFQCKFLTSDGVLRSFTFGGTVSASFYRVTIAFDLANAAVYAYVNGLRVATTNNLGSGWAPGLAFRPAERSPFGIGSTSGNANTITDNFGSACDWTLAGLKLSNVLVYAPGTVGAAQARADAATITDANRYFGPTTGAICWLPMDVPPSTLAANRVVPVCIPTGGGYRTSAYFLDDAAHLNTSSTMKPGRIEGMTLKTENTPYGHAVLGGYTNNFRASRVAFNGGCRGWGTLNFGVSYPMMFDRCTFQGADAGIYLFQASQAELHNCDFPGATYRSAIRLIRSAATIRRSFVAGGGTPDYLVQSVYSNLTLEDFSNDNEYADGGAQVAAIYASASEEFPFTYLKLDNVNFGSLGPNASALILDGNAEDMGIRRRAVVKATGLAGQNPFRSWAQVRSGRWGGTIDADTLQSNPRWVEVAAGVTNSVQSRHANLAGPPSDGSWTAGAHDATVPAAQVGQFARWRCSASGAYGTAVPPVWRGSDPVDDGFGLAAYVSDHSCWAASGAPAGAIGCWNDAAVSLFLNGVLGGTLPSLHADVYAALGTHRAMRRLGYLVEYSTAVGSYARVLVSGTNFAASSGGSAATTAAITFPTATADWRDAFGGVGVPATVLHLFDAATGGHLLASIEIAPLAVTLGSTPAIASGALTVARAARSPQGAFADAWHDKLNDFHLRKAAYTAPSLYLALSTAPASSSGPTEPSGGGYARVATSVSSWNLATPAAYGGSATFARSVVATNAAALAFPAPSGDWGTARSACLMDASTGGNVVAWANLTLPRTILSGEAARSFAPGALWINRS